MSVSLLMGWALLALLVLMVVGLVVVTLIAGRSGNPVRDSQSSGQGVPVNVFQREAAAPMLTTPGPAYRPAHSAQVDPGGPWAAHQPGGAPAPRRWYPGMGAAQPPLEAQAPMDAPMDGSRSNRW